MNTKIIVSVMAILMCTAGGAQAGFQWTAPANAPAANVAGPGSSLPHVQAAPVAPVMSEGLVDDMAAFNAIPTQPDGPAAAAPVYQSGSANDPVTWNARHNATPAAPVPAPITSTPVNAVPSAMLRAPQAVLPAETVPLYNPPASSAPIVATPIAAPMAAPITAQPAMISTTTTTTTPAAYGNFAMAEGFGRDLPLVMAIRQIVPPSYGFVFDDGINLSTNVSWQGGRPWNVVLQDTLTPLGLKAGISGTVVSIVPASSGVQQIAANAGTAVTSDMVQSYTTTTTMSPVMAAPTPIMATPAIIEGPAVFTPARASGAADLNAVTTWTAQRNSTLRGILEDWSRRVGVELYWASEYDYPIQSSVSIQGSFEEAVQTLLKGLTESKPRPLGRLHPNLPNGPAVLVIETRQNSM